MLREGCSQVRSLQGQAPLLQGAGAVVEGPLGLPMSPIRLCSKMFPLQLNCLRRCDRAEKDLTAPIICQCFAEIYGITCVLVAQCPLHGESWGHFWPY